jgi:hypothetical protein
MTKTLYEIDPHEWTKQQRIEYLLDHWDDIHNPPISSSAPEARGGGGGALLPLMAGDHSVRELVRCLEALKASAPTQYVHLMAHHTAEWRIRRWQESKRRKGGKIELVDHDDRERMVPSWVRSQKVTLAHRTLALSFRGSVEIPAELWDALTCTAEEADVRRARRRARAKERSDAAKAEYATLGLRAV